MPCAALTNPHRDASSRMHVGIHVKLKSCCYCKCSVFIINSNRPDESRERLKLFILSFTYLHSVHTHWLFRFHSRVAACGPAGPDIRETSGHWVSPGHMLPSAAAEDRWRSASFIFFFFFRSRRTRRIWARWELWRMKRQTSTEFVKKDVG